MNIGKRLRELRHAKGFSQGDIEHRTGLLRCYISRVENGYVVPSLATLEKMAHALNLELHQLLNTAHGKPEAAKLRERRSFKSDEHALLRTFGQLPKADRRLLLAMARKMAAETRKANVSRLRS